MCTRTGLLLAAAWSGVGASLQTVLDVDPPGAVEIPINSAGEHTGTQKVTDVVLLFVCLLVPFVIYGVIRVVEHLQAQQLAKKRQEATLDAGPPARLGSTYNMDPNNENRNNPVSALGVVEKDDDEGTVLQNVLAGFSTAMAALPDAISFSFITGVSPLNGIWAGVFMGFSAALVGGRPGMISSASAATAVVLAKISTDPNLGMGPMALCVFVVGIVQLICGALRLSRFITLIPHSVMTGFVNGLAIVMIRAQMRQFHEQGDGPWVEKKIVVSMIITALVAMAAAVAWKRIPVVSKYLPAPLASVIITVIFSLIFKDILPRRTLVDVAGPRTFRGGWNTMPSWDFPPTGVNYSDHAMWGVVVSIAIRFAIVGLLESLMTQALIDQITGTTGSMRRECFGQGVGNILSSFFGTQGGCALIAQSLLNVSSGGRSRVSGVVMGLTLMLSVVALAPLMGQIPVAALVGLITLIALNTFAWSSLGLIMRINWIDSTVVVLVTAITVWKDLCIAVVVGVIISGLGFAWTSASHGRVDFVKKEGQIDVTLRGPFFFGSAMNYQTVVTKAKIDEEVVVLDFTESRILDISAVDAIDKTREYLMGVGKKVVLKGVPAETLKHFPKDVEIFEQEA